MDPQLQAMMGAGKQTPQSNTPTEQQQLDALMGKNNMTPDQSKLSLGFSNGFLQKFISGVGQQIGAAAQGGIQQFQQGMQQTEQAQSPAQLLEGSAQEGAGIIGAALSPTAPMMAPIQAGVNSIADKVSNVPGVQSFAQSQAGKETSRVAQDIQNLDTIAGGVAALKGGAPAAKEGLDTAGTALEKSGRQSASTNRANYIQSLVTPEQTVKTTTQEIQAGRVQEGGLAFKGRQVEPTTQSQSIADTVSSIPAVKPSNTLLKNVNVIHDTIGKTAQDLRSQLESSKIIFPKQEVISFINNAKSELAQNPLITGDAEATAGKMLDKFTQILQDKPATPSSLLDARQEFDSWVKNQKGESVFDPAKDNAISVALKTIRQGANDFLASKVQDVPVKELLSKQSDMYRAIESIAPKAAKEAETRVGRLIQKAGNVVGVKNKIVQDIGAAVGLAGFGAAAYFAPSAAALMGVGGLGYGLFKGITSPALRTGVGKALQGAADIIPK